MSTGATHKHSYHLIYGDVSQQPVTVSASTPTYLTAHKGTCTFTLNGWGYPFILQRQQLAGDDHFHSFQSKTDELRLSFTTAHQTTGNTSIHSRWKSGVEHFELLVHSCVTVPRQYVGLSNNFFNCCTT